MRPHPLFTNYLITKDGNVINKKTNRKLKPSPNERGYLMVGLRKDKKQHTKKIHRLMMETYEPIDNQHLYHAHHKNEIKDDNRLENLEWELKGKHISKHHKGKVLSEETRKKIGEAHKGKVLSEEHRRKLLEANRGKVVSEETKKKISESKKGQVFSKEHKRKLSESHKGHLVSEETRRKIGESHKGLRHTEEARRKMRESHKGKVLSEETKRKLSEARLGKPNQFLVGKGWWNNGTKTIRSKECPGEGWVRGRM